MNYRYVDNRGKEKAYSIKMFLETKLQGMELKVKSGIVKFCEKVEKV